MNKLYNETDYKAAYAALVPLDGKCNTMQGECLRAASRIYYDYINNGFGNNWSGALAYLEKYGALPTSIKRFLKPYSTGKIACDSSYDENDLIYYAISILVARATDQAKRAIADETLVNNPCDMFDLTTKPAHRHMTGRW
jgi:hypothetical protein